MSKRKLIIEDLEGNIQEKEIIFDESFKKEFYQNFREIDNDKNLKKRDKKRIILNLNELEDSLKDSLENLM